MSLVKELPSNAQFTTELFQFTPQNWDSIEQDLLRIEDLAFEGKGYSEEIFRKDFARPEAIIVILRSPDHKIIGYSYALPVNIEEPEREDEKNETANIDSTAILPEFQGKGLVGTLVGRVEDELRKRHFKFLEREAAAYNGYADSIQKHYQGRILDSHDIESKYGPQRFFRISL